MNEIERERYDLDNSLNMKKADKATDLEWLKDYHSRVIEEYNFSMERKDRVTDWAIGIFFVTLVAYAELLRNGSPSIWRISLIVSLLAFTMRLFCNSCLAYAYLKKWRYLLDSIEKHWMKNEPPINILQDEIDSLHFLPRTTEKPAYFAKNQLLSGFLLLFMFPFFLLLYEFYANPQDNYSLIPIAFLIIYYLYEAVLLFKGTKALEMPKWKQDAPEVESNEKSTTMDKKGIDRAFDTFILIQTLIFATIFQYLTWLNKPENLTALTKITRVFFIPILIITMLWILGHLFESLEIRMILKTLAWYWSFLSFLIQALFLGAILLLDILSPQVTVVFILLVVLITLIFGVLTTRKLRNVYAESYSIKIQILSATISVVSMAIFLVFVLNTT